MKQYDVSNNYIKRTIVFLHDHKINLQHACTGGLIDHIRPHKV